MRKTKRLKRLGHGWWPKLETKNEKKLVAAGIQGEKVNAAKFLSMPEMNKRCANGHMKRY